MGRKSRCHCQRRGIATVELAVVLPFLVTLLLGVLEVGRMLDVQMMSRTQSEWAADRLPRAYRQTIK